MNDQIRHIMLLFTIILGIALILAHSSALKNIDLSWNAKHLNLEDCNGIVCSDLPDIYNNSMLYLYTIEPLIIGVYIILLIKLSESKKGCNKQ